MEGSMLWFEEALLREERRGTATEVDGSFVEDLFAAAHVAGLPDAADQFLPFVKTEIPYEDEVPAHHSVQLFPKDLTDLVKVKLEHIKPEPLDPTPVDSAAQGLAVEETPAAMESQDQTEMPASVEPASHAETGSPAQPSKKRIRRKEPHTREETEPLQARLVTTKRTPRKRSRAKETAEQRRQSFHKGFQTYSAARKAIDGAGLSEKATREALGRLSDKWEKKKKALALQLWSPVVEVAGRVGKESPRLCASLRSLFEELNLQHVLVRGKAAFPDLHLPVPSKSSERGLLFNQRVMESREAARVAVGSSHGAGRLSGQVELDFALFQRQKKWAREALNGVALDRRVKVLADRWERRKKSIAYQGMASLWDWASVVERRWPSLGSDGSFARLRGALDQASLALRGLPIGHFSRKH